MPFINSSSSLIPVYTSKNISDTAKAGRDIVNLAIGEPEFGPPSHLVDTIREKHLQFNALYGAVKKYEQSRGLPELRIAIAQWYLRRYGLSIDPETEILITHGGVEAIALAILCTSNPGDPILLTDPTYMLYARSAQTLARHPVPLERRPQSEYVGLVENGDIARCEGARSLIINSPENPTGYVLSEMDWAAVSALATRNDLWVIHDEVYDTMVFDRPHIPARGVPGLEQRSIQINSFSKKFGVPGLRIGWVCAPPQLISLAAKLHDYLYLGVNILFEHIALTLIQDHLSEDWLRNNTELLNARARTAMSMLCEQDGFTWDRRPMGGMFAFPNVVRLRSLLKSEYKEHASAGDAVAAFLMKERGLAVVPGAIYGSQGRDCIRLVLCSSASTFDQAMKILKSAVNSSPVFSGLSFGRAEGR